MNNVWKIGSNWGENGESVLDLFFEYGCVFFSLYEANRLGDWEHVEKGDLFIIADKSVCVAIGRALGPFKSYDESKIEFGESDKNAFIDDYVRLCPVRMILLPQDRRKNWGIKRGRFCEAPNVAEEVRRFWGESSDAFDIKARAVSLLDEEDTNRLLQSSIKYSVPIYQRPYSWGEPNLRRLMQDLDQGLRDNDPVFMGTIQLSQPIPLSSDGQKRRYDIIDGQQRLTTFLILLAILERIAGRENKAIGLVKENFRTSVNNRAAQTDLTSFLDFFDKWKMTDEVVPDDQNRNPYIVNAKTLLVLLKEFAVCTPERDDGPDTEIASGDVLTRYAGEMHDFISKKVKIVVIETHAGLSKTIKIFNTINSSGLDLGSEDLFKVRFYEYLRKLGSGEEVFNQISDVYERIEEYNRKPFADARLSMSVVLHTYQRELIARHDLNVAAFSLSPEAFFDRLFDTALGLREWSGFGLFAQDGSALLSVDDLNHVLDCHIAYFKACNADWDLRIIRQMLWETRYGLAWDFPVLAMVSGVVDADEVKTFARGLFKSLVPPSIRWGKQLYYGRVCLLDLTKAMWHDEFKKNDSVGTWAREWWRSKGLSLDEITSLALEHNQIAGNPRWKNLLCRLVEYLHSKDKDEHLFQRLFQEPFDVEHIQSWTDENDRQAVWKEWGAEINKIGNLAMFERGPNRSVHNHSEQKTRAYDQSKYVSLKELKDGVRDWTREKAEDRRKKLTEEILEFLRED